MKIKILFTIIFLFCATAFSASADAPAHTAVERVTWDGNVAEIYLSLADLPPTGISGVFLNVAVSGGVVTDAEVTDAWGVMNAARECDAGGVTVMLDSSENMLIQKPFLKIKARCADGAMTLRIGVATGGGLYAYDRQYGVQALPFADSVITLTPPNASVETEEATHTEETNGVVDANQETPTESYYVGYQWGIDEGNRDAIRFLILSARDADGRVGAVWCNRGHGERISLAVERTETVEVYQDGQRQTVSAVLPDGRAGIFWVYTFRGLSADKTYKFCASDGEEIQKVNVKTPRFTS